MKFNKLVCVDHTKLNDQAISQLEDFSNEVKVYSDYPEEKEEIIKRIGDAEAVLVSWRTQIDKEVIKACDKLKYIGMACSLYDDESANVAVKFAKERGITVKGIKDYGDPGVAEFIISELIQLLNGYKGSQWKDMPQELTGLNIGIIGMGVTGQLLAKCLLPFDPDLYYYSRSRKMEWETKGVKYLPLTQLLETCEVISFHLPKNTELIEYLEFKNFGNGKILINTSLGLPFEETAFMNWINNEGNFAIFDADGRKELSQETEKISGVIVSEFSAGWSEQTRERLSKKVLENIKEYLEASS
ncbi:NAD(P)-dependent oxidoreductase [Gramella sp. KN1008]|uniref:NAD(P)-dependent oxidoreductase n=1 Tax=Gramella sp. KN1008 TaxID=2529298 RepID=UPI00103939B6|nr:NAD(P)-dependent oxidoreductase [Gramella sp. KN1008]TBW28910.1 dihydrofolate reductase [Gramella sp. KN1008]